MFLGALFPDALSVAATTVVRGGSPQDARGPHGFIVPEESFYGLLKSDDEFDVVWLDEGFVREIREVLARHPLTAPDDLARVGEGKPASAIRARLESGRGGLADRCAMGD